MYFLQLTYDVIEKLKDSIESFFENNENDYNFFHPHKFSYDGILRELKSKEKDYFVFLMDNDNILGYGMLRGWNEGFEIPSLGIIIDNNHRGKKLSIKLMEHLHEIAYKKGCKKIRLGVYSENKKAISLYNKIGYTFSKLNEHSLLGIKEL